MPSTTITISWEQEHPEVVQEVNAQLENLNASTSRASEGMSGMGMSLSDLYSGFMLMSGVLSQAGGIISGLNDLGVASLRAKDALNTLSNNQGANYLEAMRASTKGLVSDMDLAKDAAIALATGVVKSQSSMAELARDGTILGEALGKTANQGIQEFTAALEHVGSKRTLLQLGIDAEAVIEEYKKLKTTMSDADAWSQALFDVAGKRATELAGALNSTGSAVERVSARWETLKASFAETVAKGIDIELNIIETITTNKDGVTDKLLGQGRGDVLSGGLIELLAGLNSPQTPSMLSGLGDPRAAVQGTMMGPPKPPDYGQFNYGAVTQTNKGNFMTLYGPSGTPTAEAYPVTSSFPGGIDPATGRSVPSNLSPDQLAQYYKDQETQRQMALMAGPYGGDASYGDGIGGTQDSFGKSQYGDTDKAAVAASDYKSILSELTGTLNDVTAAERSAAQAVSEHAAAMKNFQSVAEAFGLKSGGIGGEIGSTLTSDFDIWAKDQKKLIGTSAGGMAGIAVDMKTFNAAQKDALEQFRYAHEMDKNYSAERKAFEHDQHGAKLAYEGSGTAGSGGGPVYTKADYAADLANNKRVLDEYTIATGQATRESLDFRDAQAELSKQFKDGKISFEQEAQGLLKLAEAARTGKTSLQDLATIALKLGDINTFAEIGQQIAAKDPNAINSNLPGRNLLEGGSVDDIVKRVNGLKGGGKSGKDGGDLSSDPFAAIKASASATQGLIDGINTKMGGLATDLPGKGATAAKGLQTIQGAADPANAALGNIVSTLNKIKSIGNFTITVNTTSSGTSNVGAPDPGHVAGAGT